MIVGCARLLIKGGIQASSLSVSIIRYYSTSNVESKNFSILHFSSATMSQFADITQFGALQSILHHTRKDDVAFLALAIFSGIFYTRFIKDKPDPYHHVWFEKPQATDSNGKGAETRDIGQKLEESVSRGTYSSTCLANSMIEERPCCILGLSVWYCRRTCSSTRKGLSKSLWARCARSRPVRL